MSADPPALHSVVTFDYAKKVVQPGEFGLVATDLLRPLLQRFIFAGFEGLELIVREDSSTCHVVVGRRRHWMTRLFLGPRRPFEWALTVEVPHGPLEDALNPLPGLWRRLLGRPAQLKDCRETRRLLESIDGVLKSDPAYERVTWHKREAVALEDFSKGRASPL